MTAAEPASAARGSPSRASSHYTSVLANASIQRLPAALAVPEHLDERVLERSMLTSLHVQRSRDRVGDGAGIPERGELDDDRARREGVSGARDAPGQSGLADTARPDQGHQAILRDERPDLRDVLVTAD